MRRITELTSDEYRVWIPPAYCELRDLVLSRLTLFNARHGGEPARLMSEWQEAVDEQWLDSAAISNSTDLEQRLIREFKITYQTGNGNNHLVPILFPLDTCQGMIKNLTDQTVRSFVGIHQNNVYSFPNSKHSLDHVSGWHSVHRVSTDAEIQCPELLSPTKM